MGFDPSRYGPSVGALLALDGAGQRRMPLAGGTCSSVDAAKWLRSGACAPDLARGRAPQAALAGLWLYFSCQEEAHEVSQAVQGAEGAFWHGILHRQEPDAWNAKYWFRQVGKHPIFPQLRAESAEVVARSGSSLEVPGDWDPAWFVDLCEAVRGDRKHPHHGLALEMQLLEWQLLFDYCATPSR